MSKSLVKKALELCEDNDEIPKISKSKKWNFIFNQLFERFQTYEKTSK